MSLQTKFLAASALIIAMTGIGGAQAAVPASGELNFTVMREGDEIGSHRLVFNTGDDGLVVDIETDIAVKVMGIAFYRFEHEGRELWADGQLVSINSTTNDDGTDHRLNAVAEDGVLLVDGDARQEQEVASVIPASLWNHALVEQSVLLNTLDGSNMSVVVTEVGKEIVEANERNISATHYSITGGLNRELWYDAENILVQVQFEGGDGSEITYVLK